MKLFVIAAMSACFLMGQDAKVIAQPSAPPAVAATERPLTETELLKIQLTLTRLQLLQDKFHMADFNKEAAVISADQQSIVESVCSSIGVPKDKIQSQCGLATGLDNDGKPITSADGKPVAARVWIIPAAPAPVPSKPEAKK